MFGAWCMLSQEEEEKDQGDPKRSIESRIDDEGILNVLSLDSSIVDMSLMICVLGMDVISIVVINKVLAMKVKHLVKGAQPAFYARKYFLDYHLPEEWEISRDAELNPFKDVLVFRKMVEFLGTKPINLKGNMWESEELIENRIDWNKPPKKGDRAWHAKIRLIDLDEEEFTKTFQSIPTTRKLSKRENPSEIIDLDHFHDCK
ncbi:hypothetical protein Tco_0444583 [Tanacetum coccineum]